MREGESPLEWRTTLHLCKKENPTLDHKKSVRICGWTIRNPVPSQNGRSISASMNTGSSSIHPSVTIRADAREEIEGVAVK